jgi:hypothetical protein
VRFTRPPKIAVGGSLNHDILQTHNPSECVSGALYMTTIPRSRLHDYNPFTIDLFRRLFSEAEASYP